MTEEEKSKMKREIQSIEMELKNNANNAFCKASGCEKYNTDECVPNTCKKIEEFSKMIRCHKIYLNEEKAYGE